MIGTVTAPLAAMRLQYGVNEADNWWHFALGENRERLWARLRELDVRIIRMFVFDKHAPDPVADWPSLRAYILAALRVGAIPFLTFAKFRRPFDDPRAVRWFAEQCSEIVWSCAEEWGGEKVKNWYWCIWNEPNNDWIGGGINFEQYRAVYEAVARGIARSLAPWLNGRVPLIGGPSAEGFQPFWLDWVWRLLNEVDNSLIGFVNWHYYAEWRDAGEAAAASDSLTMQNLIMAQAHQLGLRAAQVARLLRGRSMFNMCGEWNAHSHYLPVVRARFNQSLFGATYGAAALIQFLRSGVDAEMVWTGTDDVYGYGILNPSAEPTPLYYAKLLCARHVRYGDRIRFPIHGRERRDWDAVVSHGPHGRRSIFVVRLRDRPGVLTLQDLEPSLAGSGHLIKLDAETKGRPEVLPGRAHQIELDGFGVAVVTNELEPEYKL
ncbi:MAG TPA: hypothetical protein VKE70_10650 [Candidatus Solibacter sp.]|nr:hypothetical protein [Candidatus Solibacter sp.]